MSSDGTATTLAGFGWDPHFQRQLSGDESANLLPARVMSVHRSAWQIAGPGVNGQVEPMPDEVGGTTVGDWLLFDIEQRRVVHRFERKSVFKRRAPGGERREQLIAANIDTVFIVSSCNQDFNEARLERYLAIAREAEVMAVIVLTKADSVDEPEHFVRRAAKLAPGIQIEAVNALDAKTLQCLDVWLGTGQTIALLGSSGVGKSTLSNTLLGQAQILTQSIREADDKGRHTTSARTMHHLPGGAWLLDTPGMRELQISAVKAGLDDVFAEISDLASLCRFSDCMHQGEPGCAIEKAIEEGVVETERLERWRKLVKEEAHNSASLADRRIRDREFGKLYKSVMKDKKLHRDN